jgi:hypothetical protein
MAQAGPHRLVEGIAVHCLSRNRQAAKGIQRLERDCFAVSRRTGSDSINSKTVTMRWP